MNLFRLFYCTNVFLQPSKTLYKLTDNATRTRMEPGIRVNLEYGLAAQGWEGEWGYFTQ